MNCNNRRRFERYDVFRQLTLTVPSSVTWYAFEVTSWTKNVSQEGIGLEIYNLSPDEIDHLRKIIANKHRVTASITLPDDFTIRAGCEIVWGTFLEDKNLFKTGLQILELDLRQADRWNSFIEELS
jgi:hypothetical protein